MTQAAAQILIRPKWALRSIFLDSCVSFPWTSCRSSRKFRKSGTPHLGWPRTVRKLGHVPQRMLYRIWKCQQVSRLPVCWGSITCSLQDLQVKAWERARCERASPTNFPQALSCNFQGLKKRIFGLIWRLLEAMSTSFSFRQVIRQSVLMTSAELKQPTKRCQALVASTPKLFTKKQTPGAWQKLDLNLQ